MRRDTLCLVLAALASRCYTSDDLSCYHGRVFTPDVSAPAATSAQAIGVTRARIIESTSQTPWSGRMRLTVALFKTDYTGYQANVPDLLNGVIVTRRINAGTFTTSGVEVDMTARVTQALSVSAAVANIEASVLSFNCSPGTPSSTRHWHWPAQPAGACRCWART